MQLLANSPLRFPWIAGLVLRFAPAAATRAAVRPEPVTNQLRAGAILWVDRPLNTLVTCERGVLWITLDGQPQDLIVEAGRSWRCESSARLSIHALEDAAFQLGGQREA